MSRWTDEYNKVIELFEKIKDKVDNLDCGSNEECYRFKKMFNYNTPINKTKRILLKCKIKTSNKKERGILRCQKKEQNIATNLK